MFTHKGDRRRVTACLQTACAVMFATLQAGCATPAHEPDTHEMLNAVLWRQTSAEYAVIARQTYRQARENLDHALADPQWSAALEQTGGYHGLPPAVILDLDETVFDDTGYEVRIIRRLGQYSPESFAAWCREVDAPLVPGVREFLEYAVARGVAVFYYSSRREALRECTSRNLRALRLPLPAATHLLLNDGRNKSERRAQVARDYRILLLVGDDLEDFIDGSRQRPATRRELALDYLQRWGRDWIILPNPVYGHWESSCYNFEYGLPRPEQLRRKRLELRE